MSDSNSDSDSDIDVEGLIAPIQQHDIRRIVAGQVVSDLASSVKELVDNALDADATGINIRLFNQGLDVIEVSDDGCGVPQDSRPLLAMKHATSKLRTFDELYQDSFSKQLGFRGEALFSLANISQTLVVSTRTETDTTGTKMEFKRDGYLNAKSICDVPRKVGTTVAVVKLFNALPVRRADLIKRITAQRAKMLRLIQSYAVLCVGVRFNLIDITGYPIGSSSCKTEVKMSTSEKCKSLSETVSAVLGYKFLAGLCDIRVDLDSIVKHSSDTKNWRIEGLVSKAPSTMNVNKKIARDIQFFSVNGRPVELPKMSRVVADAWRNFEVTGGESKKRPACILQIFIPNSQFDINIAPDKREVMFSDESAINEALRKALVDLWSKNGGKFLANEVENACNGKKGPVISGEADSAFNNKKRSAAAIEVESSFNGNKRQALSTEVGNSCNEKKSPAVSREIDRLPKGGSVPSKPIELEPTQLPLKRRRMQRRNAFVNHFSNIGKASTDFSLLIDEAALKDRQVQPTNSQLPISRASEGITSTNPAWGRREIHTHSEEAKGVEISDQKSYEEQKRWNQMKLHFNSPESSSQREEIEAIRDARKMNMTKIDDLESGSKRDSSTEKASKRQLLFNSKEESEEVLKSSRKSVRDNKVGKNGANLSQFASSGNVAQNSSEVTSTKTTSTRSIEKRSMAPLEDYAQKTQTDLVSKSGRGASECSDFSNKKTNESQTQSEDTKDEVVWGNFDTSSVMRKSRMARNIKKKRELSRDQLKATRKKNGGNADDRDVENKTLSLTKDDFLSMSVIGQFNLGFLLAFGHDGQLWILDQHACDEIYNFEKLCKETKIHEQNLIAPLPLELSPSEELCIREHMDVFESNGFRFLYKEANPPRHRLCLTALPYSGSGGDGKRAYQFGIEDVSALCSLLGADGGSFSSESMGNNAVRRHAGTGGAIIRLPKSVAMFASRACRSSVMIGDHLSRKKMESIITKLRDLDQPWNCPHGRPTIRHIKCLISEL